MADGKDLLSAALFDAGLDDLLLDAPPVVQAAKPKPKTKPIIISGENKLTLTSQPSQPTKCVIVNGKRIMLGGVNSSIKVIHLPSKGNNNTISKLTAPNVANTTLKYTPSTTQPTLLKLSPDPNTIPISFKSHHQITTSTTNGSSAVAPTSASSYCIKGPDGKPKIISLSLGGKSLLLKSSNSFPSITVKKEIMKPSVITSSIKPQNKLSIPTAVLNDRNPNTFSLTGIPPSMAGARPISSPFMPATSTMKKETMKKEPTKKETKEILKEELTFSMKDDDVLVEDDEDHFQADTYADYMPVKLKVGKRHPDPVVETSSLSSVHPPDVWYRLNLPISVIDEGGLSALQLESITYMCQQHDRFLPDGSRAGFLLGDGAGVGKGRTLAGIIFENYMVGRKRSIWLSVSNDLKYDAERDFKDIGAKKIQVHPLNKFKYAKLSSKENNGFRKGVVFATYSSLIGESHTTTNEKYRTRFLQLLQWCGEDFDGVIVFDECHKAKNLCPVGSGKSTKTGQTVLELQRALPKARIVYASATGASEPKNMAYMVRLGLWGSGTPFAEFQDFVNTVEKKGVGGMELVAIDMKLRGVYIARQLSFSGVQFRIENIALSRKFIALYDDCVEIWVDAKNKIERALELMDEDSNIKKSVWAQFWASHQRFFKYLCIASKVKYAIELSREALKDGKCVVIGLQSTGESKTVELLENEGEVNDFVSTAKAVFLSLIEKHFPAPNREKTRELIMKTMAEKKTRVTYTPGMSVAEEIFAKFNNCSLPKASTVPTKKMDKWSMTDSEGSDDSDNAINNSDNGLSEDSDDDDDMIDVSGEEDEIDKIWNKYESKVLEKKKTERIKKKTKKRSKNASQKKGPQPKKVKRNSYEDFINIKAESMSEEALELCERMKQTLIDEIESIGSRLPPNTLDELIDQLGGSDAVAEMTGRKGRVVQNEDGDVQYESRTVDSDCALEMINVQEKQNFLDGTKDIAIISEAASSGISLHADKRFRNDKKRVHITIELPWSADRAIQQFGRTHRSNQRSAPEYVFLISDLAGETRFASIVAKRLESLGALTHGDRRATESRDLSQFNIDNKYGRQALEVVMKSIVGLEEPYIPFPSEPENFVTECRKALTDVSFMAKCGSTYVLEKDFNSISKFLNRILGFKYGLQNSIFKYFTDTLEAVVKQAKRLGRFDAGIIDLTSDNMKIETDDIKTFFRKLPSGVFKIEVRTVSVERGLSWEDIQGMASHANGPDEGFYTSKFEKEKGVGSIFLSISDINAKACFKMVFRCYKPNTGLQSKTETQASLRENYMKIEIEEAKDHWTRIFEESAKKCSHEVRNSKCFRKSKGMVCDLGLRRRTYYILSGSILSLWDEIDRSFPPNVNHKLQLARIKTKEGTRIIGISVPEKVMELLIKELEKPIPNPVDPKKSENP